MRCVTFSCVCCYLFVCFHQVDEDQTPWDRAARRAIAASPAPSSPAIYSCCQSRNQILQCILLHLPATYYASLSLLSQSTSYIHQNAKERSAGCSKIVHNIALLHLLAGRSMHHISCRMYGYIIAMYLCVCIFVFCLFLLVCLTDCYYSYFHYYMAATFTINVLPGNSKNDG